MNTERIKIAGTYFEISVLPDYLKMIIESHDKLERQWSYDKMTKGKKQYLKDLTNKISKIKEILNEHKI